MGNISFQNKFFSVFPPLQLKKKYEKRINLNITLLRNLQRQSAGAPGKPVKRNSSREVDTCFKIVRNFFFKQRIVGGFFKGNNPGSNLDIKCDGDLQRILIICLTLSTRLVSLSIHMLNVILMHFVKHRYAARKCHCN